MGFFLSSLGSSSRVSVNTDNLVYSLRAKMHFLILSQRKYVDYLANYTQCMRTLDIDPWSSIDWSHHIASSNCSRLIGRWN